MAETKRKSNLKNKIMETLLITKYLNYVQISNTGKTLIIGVGNNSGGKLGIIKWMPGWRRYVFHPQSDTLFDAACLEDITSFIKDLMLKRTK